jgi:hypothetical protein
MHRTRKRPLPMGTISSGAALAFGIALACASLVVLWFETTPLATALAAAAILAYSVLYTMVLKRRTRHNTVFGGLPGATPVLIGWAAVTGSLAWPAIVFFGIVFCWQMPHFWALAMRFRDDYARAGVPMLSVVASPVQVGRQSLAWAWATLAVSLLLAPRDARDRLDLHGARGGARRVVRVGGPPVAGPPPRRQGRAADEAVPRLDHLHDPALDRDHRRRPRLSDAVVGPAVGGDPPLTDTASRWRPWCGAAHPVGMTTTGTVRVWHDEEAGVVAPSDPRGAVPSAVASPATSPAAGRWTEPRATPVRARGVAAGASRDAVGPPSAAYRSTLTLTFDDDDDDEPR